MKTTKTPTRAAQAASAVRTDLKAAFPGQLFTVKSDNFAGGNAVRIDWIDGPTSNEVSDLVDKYQQGHYDGMQDMYVYSNSNDELPQVKFVQTQRRVSDERKAEIRAQHNFGDSFSERDIEDFIYREVVKTSFYTKPNIEAKPEAAKELSTEKVEGLEVVDYSERAIAVFGDTKPIKATLMNMGGRFNKFLNHNGEKKAGWIFSKKQSAAVYALVG